MEGENRNVPETLEEVLTYLKWRHMEKINQKKDQNNTKDRELTISRLLDAPRELVFDVWTNPEHLTRWWGPKGFTSTISKMEIKPGGEWNMVMHGPDGIDYKNKAVYTEVKRPERLVYDHFAPKFTTTVIFKKQGNKTFLTMTMVFESSEEAARVIKVFKADMGLVETIGRLEQYIGEIVNNNN